MGTTSSKLRSWKTGCGSSKIEKMFFCAVHGNSSARDTSRCFIGRCFRVHRLKDSTYIAPSYSLAVPKALHIVSSHSSIHTHWQRRLPCKTAAYLPGAIRGAVSCSRVESATVNGQPLAPPRHAAPHYLLTTIIWSSQGFDVEAEIHHFLKWGHWK